MEIFHEKKNNKQEKSVCILAQSVGRQTTHDRNTRATRQQHINKTPKNQLNSTYFHSNTNKTKHHNCIFFVYNNNKNYPCLLLLVLFYYFFLCSIYNCCLLTRIICFQIVNNVIESTWYICIQDVVVLIIFCLSTIIFIDKKLYPNVHAIRNGDWLTNFKNQSQHFRSIQLFYLVVGNLSLYLNVTHLKNVLSSSSDHQPWSSHYTSVYKIPEMF